MNKMKLAMIKTYFGIWSFVAPNRTADLGLKMFQKVRKKDIRKREESFFAATRRFSVQSVNEPIDCFELGDPNGELVVLVHGWDSNAGSMSKIAEAFAKEGKRVITFNLPGHAFYKKSYTNLLECRDALVDVMEFISPKNPVSFVAHSFGSAVTANALSKLDIEVNRLVFLTNPNKIEDVFQQFKSIVGIKRPAYKRLIRKTTQLLGDDLSSLDVERNLAVVNYDRLLLMHDKHDKVLPFENAAQINDKEEKSQLIPFEHIGHYKMLWNNEVIGRTVAFVNGKEVY